MANAPSLAAGRDWFGLAADCCAPVGDCCAPDAVASATTISIASEIFMSVAPLTALTAYGRKRHARSATHPTRAAGNLLSPSGRARDGRTQEAEAEFVACLDKRDSPSGRGVPAL